MLPILHFCKQCGAVLVCPNCSLHDHDWHTTLGLTDSQKKQVEEIVQQQTKDLVAKLEKMKEFFKKLLES